MNATVSLIETLNALIAKELGMCPEEITNEFIAQRRSSGSRKFVEDDTDQYGDLTSGLRHLTDEEVETALQSFEELIRMAEAPNHPA
jgi:hypothetical protein